MPDGGGLGRRLRLVLQLRLHQPPRRLRHWRSRRNEGKVECQALVFFKEAAQRLGATAPQADDLYAYALALHEYKVRLFPQYRDPKCVVPPWAPPPGGLA